MTPHLTESQLDEVLLGLATPATDAHLAACPACAARKAAFTDAISGFNRATLAWSQAKSNTLTRDLIAARPQSTPRLGLAVAALCAVAAVATLIPTSILRPHAPPPAAPADRAREIDGDNAMLQEIDTALHAPEPSPEQLYRLPATAPGTRHPTEVRE